MWIRYCIFLIYLQQVLQYILLMVYCQNVFFLVAPHCKYLLLDEVTEYPWIAEYSSYRVSRHLRNFIINECVVREKQWGVFPTDMYRPPTIKSTVHQTSCLQRREPAQEHHYTQTDNEGDAKIPFSPTEACVTSHIALLPAEIHIRGLNTSAHAQIYCTQRAELDWCTIHTDLSAPTTYSWSTGSVPLGQKQQ